MPSENGVLDDVNLRLLAELVEDARLTQAELGRRVGLSAPAVAERLSRLERDGVISGYRTEVSPAALGFTLAAIIRMRPAPRLIPKVADIAR
jgi:Lrp/AsnC family leucine-responsive transcriptional regulator